MIRRQITQKKKDVSRVAGTISDGRKDGRPNICILMSFPLQKNSHLNPFLATLTHFLCVYGINPI